jgi:cytochrome c
MKVLLLAAALSLMTPGLALAAGDADAGKAVFKKCAACHMIGEGAKDRVGPVLNELFGRVAGSTPYNYSKAMQEAGAGGLVWTPETVAHFLHKPKDFVPGTKMTFAGLTDETQLRQQRAGTIIARARGAGARRRFAAAPRFAMSLADGPVAQPDRA